MTAKKAMPPGSGADSSEGVPQGERTPAAGKRRPSQAAHLAQVHFLESLDRVNRAIQQASDVEEMLWNVTETTLAIFAADRVWLLTPCNPDAPSFRVPVESTRPGYPGACASNLEIPTSPGLRRSRELHGRYQETGV
jgi:hypothetical protein